MQNNRNAKFKIYITFVIFIKLILRTLLDTFCSATLQGKPVPSLVRLKTNVIYIIIKTRIDNNIVGNHDLFQKRKWEIKLHFAILIDPFLSYNQNKHYRNPYSAVSSILRTSPFTGNLSRYKSGHSFRLIHSALLYIILHSLIFGVIFTGGSVESSGRAVFYRPKIASRPPLTLTPIICFSRKEYYVLRHDM